MWRQTEFPAGCARLPAEIRKIGQGTFAEFVCRWNFDVGIECYDKLAARRGTEGLRVATESPSL
jgi:hypothetical protein